MTAIPQETNAALAGQDCAAATSHFRIRMHRCYSVTCAECVPDAGDFQQHFSDERDLWRSIQEEGWTLRPDGRLLCSVHSAEADCRAYGHDWLDWWNVPTDPAVEYRSCYRCGGRDERILAGLESVRA